jgi:O-antigen ligase
MIHLKLSGILTYSWLAAEHKTRSVVTVAVWFIIVACAGWKQLRPNDALQSTAGRSDD